MHNIIYFNKNKENGTGRTALYLANTYPLSFKSINIKIEKIPENNKIWRI